jgi:Protein of unknown function DUF262
MSQSFPPKNSENHMAKTASSEEALEALLDTKKKDVKTDQYPMSIGEIVGMYQRGELILRPQYQRYFRWSGEQKSKLIESILIGLPLPSFFMAQDESGYWEVVDGMQRLSTILDFMGELSGENVKQENYKRFERLCDDLFYLDAFGGKSWADLSRRIQLDFKRTKIQLIVLLRETSADAKFELFQRLNSGGTAISGQELRNAILAGENSKFLKWLEELATHEPFVEVIALSDRDREQRFDMELVLRFFILLSPYKNELKSYNSLDVYLTHVMREFLKQKRFDFDAKKKLFYDTFDTIFRIGGAGALRYKDAPGRGKFSISFFEAVALGIAQNIDTLPPDTALKRKFNEVGKDKIYRDASASGKNTNTRISTLFDLGGKYFKR